MKFLLSLADCTGNKANVLYPNRVEISSLDEMLEAVGKDHVCGTFKGDKRSNANFIESTVIVMDCDNDHSEDPADWTDASKIEEMFPDVDFVIAYSRHHMIEKEGKAARPRFHIYFPIPTCTNADEYASYKAKISKQFTFFDDNALDAARFIFGSDQSEAVWHEGWCSILDVLDYTEEVPEEDFDSDAPITEGSRNNTLSRYAGRVVTRFGASDKAHELFMKKAGKCDPPLSYEELSTIWNSACKFAKKVQSQEGYTPPEEYGDDFGTEPGSLKPDDYSDIGQAKALISLYGVELLFTNATDYLRYDGKVWIENKQLAVGAMEEFLDIQLQDAMDYLEAAKKALIKAGIDEETVADGGKDLEKAISDEKSRIAYLMYLGAQTYLKFVQKHRDYKYITSALQTAKPMICADVTDLDKNAYLLNTPEATYDLVKGMAGAKEHDPNDLITKITTVSPDNIGQDIWEDALNVFFCGDKELIAYVQAIVGMAAVGKVNAEQMVIAYGGGANGKSTFWNTIARVLGTYSGKLSAEALTLNCKRNVKPEMAELKGKRLIIASELEEGVSLNTAVVKQLCSTDPIYAEKKYKDPFSFEPSHLLVLYTNHLPKVSSSNDEGIWRRLIVIPFKAHIVGSSDKKNYADYLYYNAAPAVLRWIIDGARIAILKGFKVAKPQCVVDAVDTYRQINDWLGRFLDDCCEVDPSFTEKSGELYQQYRAYCINNGEPARSTTDFYNSMDKAGFSKQKTNKGNLIHGVKLKAGNDFLE